MFRISLTTIYSHNQLNKYSLVANFMLKYNNSIQSLIRMLKRLGLSLETCLKESKRSKFLCCKKVAL